MPFRSKTFRDFVQLLEERPQWRAENAPLGVERQYLAVPEQIAELRRQVAKLPRDTDRNLNRVQATQLQG